MACMHESLVELSPPQFCAQAEMPIFSRGCFTFRRWGLNQNMPSSTTRSGMQNTNLRSSWQAGSGTREQ